MVRLHLGPFFRLGLDNTNRKTEKSLNAYFGIINKRNYKVYGLCVPANCSDNDSLWLDQGQA